MSKTDSSPCTRLASFMPASLKKLALGNMPADSSRIDYALLSQQNAATSNAIIESFKQSSTFAKLAKVEGDAILQRDQEDAEKLKVGIEFAKEKGVIDPNYVPEPYVEIDVLGKTPDAVCAEILVQVEAAKKQNSNSGTVIVLCGLSGTGKGTTVTKLREKIGKSQEVVCWSNGNIFRSVTLLAATWCEQQVDCDGKFNAEKALTKENLASFMSMLSFGKFKDGKYDTRIQGLGLDLLVSEVQNTDLKVPKVSKNIPTVAECTQGEVILFAADAIKVMSESGTTILLEGREQTVNYVRTPLRFTLVLSDDTLIGRRRAAQRLMAAALKAVPGGCNEEIIESSLDEELAKMVVEI
uniref:(d)CMP kinase n=1 Tax=Eucampia antarctica TaxID=49252 RepID=A0A7S2WKD6_9STRA|eukprot:CAMPEP_0197829012 /NCGR_PEP_ID=MMETSP1437-20131217/5483_1 /TAXON_ID=49252 ORGANISM="Eucampia antarctica, Strain CCMP1452" /NCGR_SAMPLE_ID=MMETSP1437 /ASSEMBLY_ACC=CAM_ASM_001096 /LENGTH=353 /DNA_ID=CAMNT_0043430463 /DNA_START=132 /DNA_END=1193 /DNA_ORIENTATION=+